MDNSKTCSTCNVDKPEEAFALKTQGRRHARCKECNNERTRDNYPNIQERHRGNVRDRNKSIRAQRMPMVKAAQGCIACPSCGGKVVALRLRDAARNQASEQRWLDEITDVEWTCRHCNVSGVQHNSVAHALCHALFRTSMPTSDVALAVRKLRPATKYELETAYSLLVDAGVLKESEPGQVEWACHGPVVP